MDAVSIVLPKLLFGFLITGLPLAYGTIAAAYYLRSGARSAYLQHLVSSIVAGAVTLALLWSSFFGDNLSKSSTAALILAVAPMYAVTAQGIVYGIAAFLLKKSPPGRTVSLFPRLALLIPLLMVGALLFGLFSMSVKGIDSDFAEQSSDPATLQRLLQDSKTGKADSFGIPFNLAQNPNAPPEMLAELATSEHATVRAHVARNPRTAAHVVESLRHDCASFVRKNVVQRLGAGTAVEPPPAPTGVCPKHWRQSE